jgi:cytoskeleton protein RodZ
MSEVVGVEGQQASAGTLLRQAREAVGLHAETLAATLKVPVRKLEALEEDRYDLLPDAVFVRALASSVCRTLKIDPQPVLQLLPQTAQPRLVQDNDGINAPFRSSATPKPGRSSHVSRPVVLTVAALLIAVVVVIFLPNTAHEDGQSQDAKNDPVMPPGTPAVISPPSESGPATAPPSATTASAPLTASTSLSQPPAAARTAPATTAAAPATPAPTTVAAATPAAPARAASAPAAIATPAASAASSAAIRATGIVTFRTKGSSWVQVTDANGTQVLRKLMEAGETAGASGTLPLTVTVGSVEQTEVQVRGKPFNLAPVSRDNVARFEVK